MECNFNIYEKYFELEQKLALAFTRIDLLESEKEKSLVEGYYTINEICLKYEFCRKSFYNYINIVPLFKSAKTGLKDKYKKETVHIWYEEILKVKENTPELFKPDFVKNQSNPLILESKSGFLPKIST